MGPARAHAFRPEDRIRRKADFDAAYAGGVRIGSRSFTLIAHSAGRDRPRVGFTISKSVGGAVVRNRVRRRLREAFRRIRDARWPAVDIVLQVRPLGARACYADLEAELLDAMRRYGSRRGQQQ